MQTEKQQAQAVVATERGGGRGVRGSSPLKSEKNHRNTVPALPSGQSPDSPAHFKPTQISITFVWMSFPCLYCSPAPHPSSLCFHLPRITNALSSPINSHQRYCALGETSRGKSLRTGDSRAQFCRRTAGRDSRWNCSCPDRRVRNL